MPASFLSSRPPAAAAAAGPARLPTPVVAVLAALLALLAAPGVTSPMVEAASGLTPPITQVASGWSAASAETPPGLWAASAEAPPGLDRADGPTRVRVSTATGPTRVGPEPAIDAGLHPDSTVSYDQTASGWLVAPRPTTWLDDASTPVGSRGNPLEVRPGTNPRTTIGGRDYSGHALDRMQEQGIVPSAVESAIHPSSAISGKVPGTTAYYDAVNDLTIITDTATGRIVTVDYGWMRQ